LIRSISSKAGHVREPQVHDDAVVSRLAGATRARPRRTTRWSCGRRVPDQVGDRLLLDRIVLDDEQVLDPLLDELLDPREAGLQALGGDRLVQEAERTVLQAAALVVEAGDHVHRDVPRRRVVLEPIEQHPPIDVGEPEIEGDGIRLDRAGQLEGLRAARRDDALESR